MDMQARLYLNLSVTKEHIGQIPESIKFMETAIGICQSNGFSELLHQCYIDFGNVLYARSKDTSRALKYFNLALEIAERLPNREQKICETLLSKAQILIKLGDWQSAKQVLHKGYKLNTADTQDRNEIKRLLRVVAALCYTEDSLVTVDAFNYAAKKQFYEKMGDGSCKLKNYMKGIGYYLKMLENCQANGETGIALIPVYYSLAQTYRDDGQYDLALDYLWKDYDLESVNMPHDAYSTLINIYEIFELQAKSFWEREQLLVKARAQIKKTDDKELYKNLIGRFLDLYKREKMDFLGDSLRKEVELEGFDVDKIPIYEHHVDDSVDNTPDIGNDICLDDLSDSSLDEENTKPVTTIRKRRSNVKVTKNMKGETQLHLACISGSSILVERLLDQKHPTNCRDNAGWLPLHEACNMGHINVVELLLRKGGSSQINDRGGAGCDGITPLYDACRNGHLEIVNLLLDHNANPTFRSDFGETPLDGLEKWHSKVKLTSEETTEYNKTRTRLSNSLQSVGIMVPNPSEKRPNNSDSEDSPVNVPSSPEQLLSDNSIEADFGTNRDVKRKTVLTEYRLVMDSMRHKNQDKKSPAKTIAATPQAKRSAYLTEMEVDVIETWMENDVYSGPVKKKHGISPRSSSSSSLKRYRMPSDEQIFSPCSSGSGSKIVSVEKRICLPSTKMFKSSLRSDHNPYHERSINLTGPERENSSNSDDMLAVDNFYDSNNFEIPSSPTRESISSASNNIGRKIMMHVECSEHTFVIVLDSSKKDELTMQWLSENVADRYYQ